MPGAMVTAKCKTCDTECVKSELWVSMIHVMFVLPWLSVRCEWQAVTRVAISNKNHNFISENNWVSHTITESGHTNNVTHRGAIGSNVQISSKNVPVFLLKVFQEFHSLWTRLSCRSSEMLELPSSHQPSARVYLHHADFANSHPRKYFMKNIQPARMVAACILPWNWLIFQILRKQYVNFPTLEHPFTITIYHLPL